jgi:hypothetical protein
MSDITSSDSLCSKCQALQLKEETFQGFKQDRGYDRSTYLRLKSPSLKRGPYTTRIGRHSVLKISALRDEYPTLDALRRKAETCKFCSFIHWALTSEEFRLAMSDLTLDLEQEAIPIGIWTCYTWEPESHPAVGLDALYIYILCFDSSITSDRRSPVLNNGPVSTVRFSIHGNMSSSDSKSTLTVALKKTWDSI